MTTRHSYTEKLEDLKIEVVKMGGLVEEAISKASHALLKRDIRIAEEVIENEEVINQKEIAISDMCVIIIATEQPVAHDLRFLISTLKILRELERIGDYANHLAKASINLSGSFAYHIHENIGKMCELSRNMLKDSMKAYMEEKVTLAAEIIKKDDLVDTLYLQVFKDFLMDMKSDPEHVKQLNTLIFISKYLERLADHVTNICEEIEYSGTGERREPHE